MTNAEQMYPRILKRIRGAWIDGIIIPVAAVGSLILLNEVGVDSGHLKAAVAVLIILALEPFAVSLTGGSIGHHLVGMRVRRLSSDRNLGIVAALARFIVKTLLGLPAFLVVLTTKRRQALHDVVARSVVVYKDGRMTQAHEALPELTLAEEHKVYVSVWRRLLVVFAYWFISLIAWSITVGMLCADEECTGVSETSVSVLVGLLVVVLIATAILGWRGYLYGARRQRHASY